MTEKIFTQDWFTRCIPAWTQFLSPFKNQPNLSFLEIGSYEGRSTCWLLDNILTHPTSKLTCIDLWAESKNQGLWAKELYEDKNYNISISNFLNNTKEYQNKLIIINGKSQKVLRTLGYSPVYDLIYIDGSHIACDVLEDIILAFRLLKVNGILITDDYMWDLPKNPLREPRIAINAFLAIFKGQYNILHVDQQIILQKIATNNIVSD